MPLQAWEVEDWQHLRLPTLRKWPPTTGLPPLPLSSTHRLTPQNRTAISYAMLATVCFVGGPLVNKMGIKWALVIGAATFPIRGASYYCNSKFGNQWASILTSLQVRMVSLRIADWSLTSLVSHLWQLLQRHRLWVLVCGGSRIHPLLGALRCSRKVSGALDRLPQSWATSWWRYQVSMHFGVLS